MAMATLGEQMRGQTRIEKNLLQPYAPSMAFASRNRSARGLFDVWHSNRFQNRAQSVQNPLRKNWNTFQRNKRNGAPALSFVDEVFAFNVPVLPKQYGVLVLRISRVDQSKFQSIAVPSFGGTVSVLHVKPSASIDLNRTMMIMIHICFLRHSSPFLSLKLQLSSMMIR